MPKTAVLLTLLLAGFAARAEVWGELVPGRFLPGFETRNLIDEFRPARTGKVEPAGDEERGRALQLSIWYPSHGGSETPPRPMRLVDYVRLEAEEFSAPEEATSGDPGAGAEQGEAGPNVTLGAFPLEDVADRVLDQALALETRAVAGAPPAAGRFPLLVLIPGNHDPAWRHFVLAEYLASHGYVAAAFPSAGRRIRDTMNMDFGFEAFRDQIQDAAFAVDYLRSEFATADPSRVMLFGFSIGGNTGGFNLLRDIDIDGFVCLDCGIGSTWGTPYLKAELRGTFPAAATRELAILHVSEGGERNDDSFIDAFERATAYHAIAAKARHFNFTSLGAIAAEVPAIEHERWLASGRPAREIHDETMRLVRLFLDVHLKSEKDARSKIEAFDERRRVHVQRVVDPG